MNYQVIFESENILFINLNEKLVDDYLEMVNDPEVASMISHEVHIYTKEEELNWLKTKLQENAKVYSMLEKHTGDFIGNIEILKINNNIGKLGITITPRMQNKHYGTEAVKTLLKYAYEVLKLDGMELGVFSNNQKAIHCYKKAGFVINSNDKTSDDIHMINYKK